jgi:tRNA A-37 threonylcarbamoyl transferase component Bud32
MQSAQCRPLSGGVSSDIWLISSGDHRLVVKRPLKDLKVAEEWQAPLARSRSEADWLRTVGELVPGACPKVLAFDADQCLIALEYLEPSAYSLWKTDLMAGRVDVSVAEAVGSRLGLIHRLTAARPELATRFGTDDLFQSLRVEPYLRRIAQRHPSLHGAVDDLVRITMTTRLALVHGDVSPKNILVGPSGPVLLDAECAWWGDPAFDAAFCLNHLLLKSLQSPPSVRHDLSSAFGAFVTAYAASVDWEEPDVTLTRVARLLPALLLARVDGRSPVEYLGSEQRDLVRQFALPLVVVPELDLTTLHDAWKEAVG